jgi:hypothetical protein
MCSHYQALKERELYRRHFGVEPPADLGKHDLWPGYLGTLIRRHPHADVGDEAVPQREALNGLFGLVPHWSPDTKMWPPSRNCMFLAGMKVHVETGTFGCSVFFRRNQSNGLLLASRSLLHLGSAGTDDR